MANAIFGPPSENVIGLGTWVASSPDTGYPASLIGDWSDRYLGKRARLADVTGYFTGTYGSYQRMDVVALWTNADAGFSTYWQGSNDNFATTPLSTTFTIPARRANGYAVKVLLDLTAITGYTTTGFLKWRLSFIGSNSANLQAKLWGAKFKRPLGKNLAWGAKVTRSQTAIHQSTTHGYRWAYDLKAAPRQLQGVVRAPDATRDQIVNWFEDCGGSVKPTLFIPDPSVNDAWIARLQVSGGSGGVGRAQLDGTQEFVDYTPLTISVEEVVGGLPE